MATPAELQQLYLAYFGRPADPSGITFFAKATVVSVEAGFSASAESQALYGSTFGPGQVNAIYMNLFNRPAEPAGVDFWTGLVANGTFTPAGAAYAILQGAGNDDLVALNNKITVATAFTAALGTTGATLYTGNTVAANVRKFIATIDSTTTAAVVGTAQAKGQTVPILNGQALVPVASVAPSGGTFTLTTTGDLVAGTGADETIVGTEKTYGSLFDIIDGGAGTDTLSLSATPSVGDIPVAGLSNVERLAVTGTGSYSVIFGSGVTGLTEVVNSGPQVSFLNVPNKVNVSILNTDAPTTVKVVATALAGTADNVTLTLVGTGTPLSAQFPKTFTLSATTPGANEYESLTIVSSGTTLNATTLATDATQTSLKTINITGAAALNLHFAADNILKSATTINASAATGGVTIGGNAGALTLGSVNSNVTLGSGNDAVYFGVNLSSGDIVDGGAGTDTLGAAATITDTAMANVRNFEVIAFDLSGATITQDASIGSLVGYNFGVTHGAALVLNNVLNNTATTVTGVVTTLTETLRNGIGGNDSITVVLDGTSAFAQLGTLSNVAGLETLNLVSTATPQPAASGTLVSNEIFTADQVAAAHVVTGNTDLTIRGPLAATSFDASAFTGRLNVTLGAVATGFQGGSGNDTVWLGVAGSNVAAAHRVTLGGGSDTVVFTGNNPAGSGAATNYTAFANVADFALGGLALGGDTVAFSSNRLDFSLHDANGVVHTGLADTFSTVSNTAAFKLATGVAFGTNVAATLANAMGAATFTNLAANGNYMVLAYDTTNSKAVYAVVNTGASAAGDTVLSAADFTATGVAVVGTLDMTAANYASYILQ